MFLNHDAKIQRIIVICKCFNVFLIYINIF
nr:MAG TPA: hypothetical protein [Caudoviricetes sp.]